MADIEAEAAQLLIARLERIDRDDAARAAERIVTLASLARAVGGSSDDPFRRLGAPSIAASEVSAALKLSARTAKGMVAEALELSRPAWRPLLEAMHAGLVPQRRARTILDAATPVPQERLAAFVAEAVAVAAPTGPDGSPDADGIPSPGALGRKLRRLAERHAADPLAVRKAKAREHRRVDIEPAGDAMCWLTAYLPLEDAAAIDTRLESMARSLQGPSESRTLPQLRADVFADLVSGVSAADLRPAAGPGAQIVVTVPLATLEGSGDAPGEILGYGPLDPDAARLLAARAATWTRLWVDPGTGAPLALGRTRYQPSAAMRHQLGARDMVCRFPGCDRPSTATDADHTMPWASGGETDTDNLGLLCREHHRLKSEGHWRARQIGRPKAGADGPGRPKAGADRPDRPDRPGRPEALAAVRRHLAPPGTIEWTSPAGRRYITYPEGDPPPPF
ncbi:HNH endonuclease signature motif containing protein [Sinomonas soli]